MSQAILLIQEDPDAASIVLEAFRSPGDGEFQVEWVRRCSEGVERLNRDTRNNLATIDAVVVEMNLSDSDGVATFDRLFQAAPHVPILVITDVADEAAARLAVTRGAQDYLLKGYLDGYLLPKTVTSMIERASIAQSLYKEKEQAQVTLNSIGDAVISTDVSGNVTYLNVVAERLTGWTGAEAFGQSVQDVFCIIDATTREPARNPMALAMRENRTVSLTPNCALLRRDGSESAIEDSAAPIHDRHGDIIGAVIVFHDVSAARAMWLRMSHLAQHDSLTGLPNRVTFTDRLHQAMAMSDRHKDRIAVLFMDLDMFKHTNDTLGHAIGDGLLKAVADRLCSCVRASDTVSRLGGDEFVILLPEIADVHHTQAIARKLLLALRAPYVLDGHELNITCSIGIAMYPDDGRDVDTLLRNADLAMYEAKEKGRNNCQFFKSGLHEPQEARQASRLSAS